MELDESHVRRLKGSKTMKRCEYYIAHKNRSCHFYAISGKNYCGQHLYRATGEGKKRIPCPLNPGHDILEEDLQRHLKKCTYQQRLLAQQKDSAYSENINKPNTTEPQLPPGPSRSERRSFFAQNIGCNALLDLISKIEGQHSELEQLELVYEIPEVCSPYLTADGRRPFKLKHALQQASIIGYLIQKGIFAKMSNPPIIIEFGAGKAYLSSMISDCTQATRFVLIDSQAFKLKAERTMRSNEQLNVRRIRMDLKDCDLSQLPEIGSGQVSDESWSAIGKHLCRASTDYAMIACQRAVESTVGSNFKGLFIAPCCHHRCDWESYSAKEQFLHRGLTKEDFELVSWMTGWALCDHQSSTISVSQSTQTAEEIREEIMQNCEESSSTSWAFWRMFPKEYRVTVGMKCKHLIDACRMEWLRAHGFHSNLTLYVPSDISPENKFLSAMPCND